MSRPRFSLVILLLSTALPLSAHPHVFIDNKMTVEFENGVLQGIGFNWTFDEMFSGMILSDYDPKRTGKFDPGQVKAVKAGAFDNLANYHYFISLEVGDRKLDHFTVERFSPSVADKGKLVYSFFVPLKIPLRPTPQTVRVTVYDDSYYVAFDLLHLEKVNVLAGPKANCDLSIEKTKVKPLWPGQFMPDQLVIRFEGCSMKRQLLALLLLAIAACCFGQVGSNPFTAKDSRPRTESFLHSMTSGATAFFVNAMAPIQKSLNESLAAITRSLQGSHSLRGLALRHARSRCCTAYFTRRARATARRSFPRSFSQTTRSSGTASLSGT